MNDIRISGTGKISGGEYNEIKIDGMATCLGNINAKMIDVDGKFKCEGTINANLIDIDGMVTVLSDIKAATMCVDGMFTVKNGGRVECESIKGEGYIQSDGEVSADNIVCRGYISAGQIVGDYIEIDSSRTFGRFLSGFINKKSKINLIEATTVKLKGIYAKEVNGRDIEIGDDCDIESIDCTGTLKIHPNAKIGRVTGNYTVLG